MSSENACTSARRAGGQWGGGSRDRPCIRGMLLSGDAPGGVRRRFTPAARTLRSVARLRQPRRRRRARCSSACPASPATATTSRPRRSTGGGGAGGRAPAATLGVPEIQVPSRAGRDGARRRRASTATRRRACTRSGVTGTNGKTTTAFLVRALLEAAGRQTGLLGTVKSVDRRGRARRCSAPRPRRSTCSARSGEMRDAGDRGVCDGGLLARARAPSGRRDPFRRGVFTNLTQDHLDFHPTMEDYFAAKRRLFTELRPRARRSSTSMTRTARGWPRELDRAAITFALGHDATYRADATSDRPRRLALHRAHARTASSSCAPRCADGSTSTTSSGRSRRRVRSARRGRRVAAIADGRPGARALSDGRRGPGLRGPGRLRPHPGLAGERPQGGARAHRRAVCTWCSGAAATAIGASAR